MGSKRTREFLAKMAELYRKEKLEEVKQSSEAGEVEIGGGAQTGWEEPGLCNRRSRYWQEVWLGMR